MGPSIMLSRSKPLLPGLALAAALLPGVAFSQAAAPVKPAPAAAPTVKRVPTRVASLSNGLKLLCRTNDSSEIVSVVCLIRAGLPDEREEQAGLAALTADALLRGTTNHTAQGFNDAIIQAGGDLRSMPGFDLTEVTVVCDKTQFEAALKLVADVVARPSFTEEQVTAAREALKRRTLQFEDDFTGASYQALVGQLYPHTPYGRPMNGYPESLDKLKAADVRKFWEQNYLQNRMVVSVVGDVDSTRAMNLAEKAFQNVPWKPGAAAGKPAVETITKPKTELVQRPGPAAQLMVGYLAPGVTRENYPVYALLDAIVGGGKRGRLFANIREKHSLGYQLGSFYQPLLNQSHLVNYVVTPPFRRNPRTEQPESVVDLAKTQLLQQLKDLATTGPTDQELARARSYVVGRYALRAERTRDQAKWLAWNVAMGLGTDFDQYFSTQTAAVTKEQITAAAKGIVNQYALVVTLPDEQQ